MGLGFGEGFTPIDNIEIILKNDSVLIDHKWYVVSNVDSDTIETIDGFTFPRDWVDQVIPVSEHID
jgi:hypothetical protein|tara:strand:+ start:1029 stop:1226 length:198 start_codon:yes stop_codon:yes gene_type:complete